MLSEGDVILDVPGRLDLARPTQDASISRVAVLALVSGLSSRDRASRDLMMIQCFVDDSGHGNGPVLILAGFFASVDTWLAFNDDWQAVLDLPPRFEYLRMREAWRCRYPKWSETERDARLILFRDVIIKHALGAIRVAVPHEAYKRTVGLVPGWNSYYRYALYQLIKEYRRNNDELGLQRDVTFIFDEQVRAQNQISKSWRFFKAQGNEKLLEIMGGSPMFQDDKKIKPLQAADLLAWTARRRTEAHLLGEEQPAFPWKKGDGIRTLDVYCSEETLQRAAKAMTAPASAEELLHLRRFRGFR